MSQWTKPRAYIIRFDGKQTKQYQTFFMMRALDAYNAHKLKLIMDDPPISDIFKKDDK